MGEEVGKVVISVILSFIAFKFSGEGDKTTDISHHVRETCVGTLE